MLYESMTIDELERRVYIEPQNREAMAVLFDRTLSRRDNEMEDLRDQVSHLEHELDEANSDLARYEADDFEVLE